MYHILSSHVTQGPSMRWHIQIGQFERNLIKGPFTKVSRVEGECSPLRWVNLLPALGQIANICWIIEKTREFQKNIYFCFSDYAKAFDYVDHNKW